MQNCCVWDFNKLNWAEFKLEAAPMSYDGDGKVANRVRPKGKQTD